MMSASLVRKMAALLAAAIFVPAILRLILEMTGAAQGAEAVSLWVGVPFLVVVPWLFLYHHTLPRLWLLAHRLPRDKEAIDAVASFLPRWRDRHPSLTLVACRYAYRRADAERPSFVAADAVAQAYASAGGRDPDELFGLLRAFHPDPGAMDGSSAKVARAVGLRNIVASLQAGVPVGIMVEYVARYGVKQLEEGLAAGIPFEYMEVMRDEP